MNQPNQPKPLYGGRALPHGVLMVGPDSFAVAVRKGDGPVETATVPFRMPFAWARNVPFLRGILAMGGAMTLALRSGAVERRLMGADYNRGKQIARMAAPMVLASLLERVVSRLLRRSDASGRRPVPGVVGMLLPMAAFRLTAVSRTGRSTLQYHGAEHMAVNAAEAGLSLTSDNVARQSRIHPRCGTTFAVWAMFIGSRIGRRQPKGVAGAVAASLATISVAYEITRLGAKLRDRSWAALIFGPAWQAQQLTTMPPDRAQIEVACAALEAVRTKEPTSEESAAGMV